MQYNETALTRHLVLTSSSEVRRICRPLFQYCHSRYFSFIRHFANGTELCLTANPDWKRYFLANGLYKQVKLDKDTIGNHKHVNKTKLIYWDTLVNSTIIPVQKHVSGIYLGLTIVKIKQQYTDFYHIGTDCLPSDMPDFYRAHINLLLRFCDYFYAKAHRLIEVAAKPTNLLVIPTNSHARHHAQASHVNTTAFLNATDIKKFFVDIDGNGREIAIPKKEWLCLNQLCLGKTAAEIAETLYLSKRTVDSHLEHVKNRLGIHKRSQLISLLQRHGMSGYPLLDDTE